MNYFSIISFIKLIFLLKKVNPNIVQTWLIHGDLIGGFAANFQVINNIIWNVRYSNLELRRRKFN